MPKRPAPSILNDVPGLLAGKTDEEALALKREAADTVLNARRRRRAHPVAPSWDFPVPMEAAHLFDAMEREGLTEDVLALDAVQVAATALEMSEEAALDAVAVLARYELATVSGEGLGARITLHPDGKCWF